MKDFVTALLASSLVVLSLIGLLLAENTLDYSSSAALDQEQSVSDVGLRVRFKR